MRNRNIIIRRLEKCEGQVEKLYHYLQRGGSKEDVEDTLRELREALDDAKVFVNQEPLGPNEINS